MPAINGIAAETLPRLTAARTGPVNFRTDTELAADPRRRGATGETPDWTSHTPIKPRVRA
jgi:hypothetical protein